MKNRLRLDFSLQTTTERLDFLNSYLPTLTFEPNEHELETLGDYILWGKNPHTGLNAQQEGITTIKEWAPTTEIDSIEGLLASPGFQESRFKNLGATHYLKQRVVFNRENARMHASPDVLAALESLWDEIDRVELIINYYDLIHGKRQTNPRTTLLQRFSLEQQQKFHEKAMKLPQRRYLQLRHYLVELRTQQYTYLDSYQNIILPRVELENSLSIPAEPIRFDTDIQVRPLGLFNGTSTSFKIFNDKIDPLNFTDKDLHIISNILNEPEQPNSFSFENPDHIIGIYKTYIELQKNAQDDPSQIDSSAAGLLYTIQFYERHAHLTDLQREILNMKIEEIPNAKIANHINKKYGTTYRENYISTIYRKKILGEIAKAATEHRITMENIFYPENFKRCITCGKLLPRENIFFMRQRKNADGLSPRCKRCDSARRAERKLKTKEGQKY